MNLFQFGEITLHSGNKTFWKINCDALTIQDWQCLAKVAVEMIPPFGQVEGVPSGGLIFAECLKQFQTNGPVLICDDVLTTGNSMEEQRGKRDAVGIVVFARGKCPEWVTPIFRFKYE